MDYEELSRVVAKELGGNVPAEVEAELGREETRSWHQFVIDAVTVGGFVVQVADLALRIADTNKTPDQLIADLQKKAASAAEIAKEMQDKVIKVIVAHLPWSK